jgi:hypothetical protein
MVDFGTITSGSAVERQVRVRFETTHARVLRARATDYHFDARVASQLPGEYATVTVLARLGQQLGLRYGTIRIYTSSPYMPELIVPVRAVLTGSP